MFEDTQVVHNGGSEPIQVWFEPWGMPHTLPPGNSFRVLGRSDRAGQLEIVASGCVVMVYAWVGSTVQIFDGDTAVDNLDIPFPDCLPDGMTTRGFAEFLFGKPDG